MAHASGEIRYISTTMADYPPLLLETVRGPAGIYVRRTASGDPPWKPPCIAIVGTRHATPEGKKTAHEFARRLSQAGFTIVSGLAFGIDAAAHEGCLEAGGLTIAVLAGGLNDVYPHTHRGLAEKILASGGALVSEHPVGELPYGYRFIERNRIISGLSRGVLVVEAPPGSGSLATAGFALEQNRDVFVIPGGIAHPNFKGSNALIRQGAQLVADPGDILETYGIARDVIGAAEMKAASAQETLILKALQAAIIPLDVDKIIGATKLEPRIAHQLLSFLLVRGMIKETAGGYTI